MRLLVCAGGGVGNMVMATPLLSALGRMGLKADVFCARRSASAASLLEGWNDVERIMVEGGKGDTKSLACRRAGPFSCPRSPAYDIALVTVWGEPPRDLRASRTIRARPLDLRRTHEAEANMSLARLLGYRGRTPPPHVGTELYLTDLDPGTFWAIGTGCNPDAFWLRKRWRRWEELTRLLPGPVVLLGAREESQPWMCSEPRFLDLCGRTSLRQAAGIIALSRAFLGIDNGLAHVAAALRVPSVVLFGATSEVKNRPLGGPVELLTLEIPCRPCQMTPRWDSCSRWRCMNFSPEEVASAALRAAGR